MKATKTKISCGSTSVLTVDQELAMIVNLSLWFVVEGLKLILGSAAFEMQAFSKLVLIWRHLHYLYQIIGTELALFDKLFYCFYQEDAIDSLF